MRRFVSYIFISALLSTAVCAADSGVWNGTIGEHKVTVCFNKEYSGSYYYERHLQPIRLEQSDKENPWKESDGKSITGLWTLDDSADKMLTGQWTKPDGTNPLPIRLKWVSDENCGGDGYNKAIEIPLKTVVGKTEHFNGRPYRRLTVRIAFKSDDPDEKLMAETIELLEGGPQIEQINRQLREALPKAVEEMYECRRIFLEHGGRCLHIQEDKPVFRNKRWLNLSSSEFDQDCGHGRYYPGLKYRIWDLETGKEADLRTWFKGNKSDYDYKAPKKLNDIIIERTTGNGNDCADIAEKNNRYRLHLGKKGMIFSTTYLNINKYCNEDIEVPYRRLLPFLTEQGKAEVRLLMDEKNLK